MLNKLENLTWKQGTAIALALLCLLAARPRAWSLLAGLVFLLPGVAIRIWACGYLRKNEELAVMGPYAYLRDPLYLGTLLIGTGLTLAARVWPLLLVFWAGFFLYYMPYKRRREGERLEQLFGEQYRRYKTAVPSLVPRLKRYTESVTGKWEFQQVFTNSEHATAAWAAVAFLWLLIVVLWRRGEPLIF